MWLGFLVNSCWSVLARRPCASAGGARQDHSLPVPQKRHTLGNDDILAFRRKRRSSGGVQCRSVEFLKID
uniref:Putative secreted protein n=1 Tax=Ixodes ricinus TaxID=34613 RepID=A0A6B0U1R0_IXORI